MGGGAPGVSFGCGPAAPQRCYPTSDREMMPAKMTAMNAY